MHEQTYFCWCQWAIPPTTMSPPPHQEMKRKRRKKKAIVFFFFFSRPGWTLGGLRCWDNILSFDGCVTYSCSCQMALPKIVTVLLNLSFCHSANQIIIWWYHVLQMFPITWRECSIWILASWQYQFELAWAEVQLFVLPVKASLKLIVHLTRCMWLWLFLSMCYIICFIGSSWICWNWLWNRLAFCNCFCF